MILKALRFWLRMVPGEQDCPLVRRWGVICSTFASRYNKETTRENPKNTDSGTKEREHNRKESYPLLSLPARFIEPGVRSVQGFYPSIDRIARKTGRGKKHKIVPAASRSLNMFLPVPELSKKRRPGSIYFAQYFFGRKKRCECLSSLQYWHGC